MSGPILKIQNDPEYGLIRIPGRFSITVEQASSRVWLFAAVQKAQERMIRDMALRGYEYQDQYGFDLSDPQPHVEVSEDTRPDPGPAVGPDPRDLAAQEAWEREEKSRVARNVGDVPHLVDYEIRGVFKRRLPVTFRRIN